ncbi:cardiolipin synthase A [Marinobacterium nitratireducens]|uniref:Cardiolipin synthase n=1 Tax=Marinobacterium nitratireducens TaxID=518897 RepID=A0A917ZC43_9GAMM|nr:cardiolipin synthase [Marinobacterium nitratireducens]GGO78998.1 cardiolipin synthase A [Marinobacterium nitratireducens]
METLTGLPPEHEPVVLALAAFVMLVLGIVSGLNAIMTTRTAQGAVAWVILLVVFPPLMVPLYWVFGRRRFRGYAQGRGRGRLEVQNLARSLNLRFQPHIPRTSAADQTFTALERLAKMPFTRGNEARLLINGDRAFEDMFAAIRTATHYVLLEFYIVRDDEFGRALGDLLISRVRDGVRVRFLYDEIGSFQTPRRFFRSLADAGVDIRPFHSTKGLRNRFQLNFRNHRKIVVVDGDYACVGGVNVGREYVHKHPVLSPWRDTSVALRGPAVQAVQLAFVEDWYWATDRVPASLNWVPSVVPTGGVETFVLSSGPADTLESCALYFLHLIQTARQRLWIVSPYFVPDAAVVAALQLAALRGVDVRILLPELADKRLMKLSSYTYIGETIFCGVKFYRYQNGFLHQKVLLVDDELASIGTANLDNRSFRLNFEISILNRNRQFAGEVAAMLREDFLQSRQLSTAEVKNWSLPLRLVSRCAYLLAPIQ